MRKQDTQDYMMQGATDEKRPDFYSLTELDGQSTLEQRLVAGMNLLADTVKVTLGAKGRTVIFNDSNDKVLITKDGATVAKHVHSRDPYQEMAIKVVREASSNTMISAGDGPVPVYTKVLTPSGFVEIGSLSIGDKICGTMGTIQTVVGTFPKGQKEIVKITLEGGQVALCCNDHLWSFCDYTSIGYYHVKPTEFLSKHYKNVELYLPTYPKDYINAVGLIPAESFDKNNLSLKEEMSRDNIVQKIVNIEYTGEFAEMMCIKVSNEDHLYIMDDYIITHNTTSTLVLAQAVINGFLNFKKEFELCEAGVEFKNTGYIKQANETITFYDFNQSCERFLPEIIKAIQSKALDVETNSDKLQDLASVSANDPAIGELIQNILNEIGVYGDIEVISDKTIAHTDVEIVKGIRINRGFFSPVFCNKPAEKVFERDNMDVLIISDTLRDPTFLNPFVKHAMSRGKGLLVLLDDIAPIALKMIEEQKGLSSMPLVIVEHDGMGDNKVHIMNDIAIYTNAAIIRSDFNSQSASESKPDFFKSIIGTCERVRVTDSTCAIIKGDFIQSELDEQIAYVRGVLAEQGISSYQRKFNKKRLGYLTGGMAVISVGGQTEMEMSEIKDRMDDAVLAVKSAVREGICLGGGYTWANIFMDLQAKNTMLIKKRGKLNGLESHVNLIIEQVFMNALVAPLYQLLLNADLQHEYSEILTAMTNKRNPKALDLKNNQLYKASEYRIYDAAAVLIDAITNAVSVSKSLLSINRAVFDGVVHPTIRK